MTLIKCSYLKNGYGIRYRNEEPIYCIHRGLDGICLREETEVGEEDSGWVATCDTMQILEEES